jgi:hypothetical protein
MEIGPPLEGALLLLLESPAGDRPVVSTPQDGWHLHAAEFSRAGEMGVL